MTHWIKAPLLLVVTNLACNCYVFGWASACPWFSTSLAEKHPNPKGKGCFTPHHPCGRAEGKAIRGGSTQPLWLGTKAGQAAGGRKGKKTSPPLVHQLGPQGCLQPRKSLLCPTASALEVTWLQLPQSALAPWIKALPSGRVSGSRATVLSCSSPPGKHFHFLITPESPPQSLPRQMWLELHIFSHPLNKEWGFHIHSDSPICLFIQLFALASDHPCNHYKLTTGETEPACCPAKGHGPLVLLQ